MDGDYAGIGIRETKNITKKYQLEPLPGGIVRIHLDEKYPSSCIVAGNSGRYYGPADSRGTLFSHIIFGNDIVEILPPHSGIEIRGHIDVKPIQPQDIAENNNKNSGGK